MTTTLELCMVMEKIVELLCKGTSCWDRDRDHLAEFRFKSAGKVSVGHCISLEKLKVIYFQ